MADKTVSLKLQVEAQGAATSLTDLKKQIKDLQNQAIKAGENSPLGNQFLKQAGEAKDRLSDLTRQVNNFQDAGARFGAVTKLVGSLASGFQAAQGAAALFGSSGEDLQKVLVRVQAATAVAQGVQGIAGLGESFKDVGAIVKGPVVAAFTTLRGALIATGIGALAVVAGLLYENFDKVKTVLANIIPLPVQKAFGVLKDAIGYVVDGVKNLVGLGDSATGVLKTMGTFGTFLNNTLKNTYATQQQGFKAIKDYNEQLKAQQDYIKALTEAGKVGSIGYYSFLLGESNKQLNKLVPGTEAYNKELRNNIALQKQLNDETEREQILKSDPKNLKSVDGLSTLDSPELNQLKKIEGLKTKIVIDESGKRNLVAKKEAENRKLYLQAVTQSASGALGIISGLGNIFIRNAAKQEKFQKKIAATQLLIDTASGISSVVREASKAGFPAAIPIIIGGVAMVLGNIAKAKAILSKAGDVSVPSIDAGGAVGAGGGAVPNNPSLTTPTTQLNGAQGSNNPPPMQPVLVVETFNHAHNRINVIETRARFH